MSWLSTLSSLDVTEPLVRYLAGNALLAYGVIAATTLPPLVPNSAILVTAGVLASRGGHLNVAVVILVVALSALLGDMLIHRGGTAMSTPVLHRLYRRPRRRALLDWTSSRIQRYGVPFVIACRFLPSGRLFGGLAAGIVRFPARWYLVGAATAEAVWASYSVGLGYFGGRAFSDSLYAVVIGLAVCALVALIGGLVQWLTGRRQPPEPPCVADHRLATEERLPALACSSRAAE